MKTTNKYKYYLYYLYDENIDDNVELYAYTDNKELAKQFEKERDMNLFHKRVMKFDRSTVNNLVKYNQPNNLMLMNGYTKDIDNPGIPVPFSLVVTEAEEMSLISSYDSFISYEIFSMARVNPFCFNKKIFNALKYIDYVYSYMYCYEPEKIEDIFPNAQYDYEFDIFGGFIKAFGKYLRKD